MGSETNQDIVLVAELICVLEKDEDNNFRIVDQTNNVPEDTTKNVTYKIVEGFQVECTSTPVNQDNCNTPIVIEKEALQDNSNTPILNETEEVQSQNKISIPVNSTVKEFKVTARDRRLIGESYVGYRRKKLNGNKIKIVQDVFRGKRVLGPTCTSQVCEKWNKRNCSKITQEQRQEIFRHFWKDLSWDEKKQYVRITTKVVQVQQNITKVFSSKISKRNNSVFYYLKVDDKLIQVCKKMYLQTLALTPSEIHYWILKDKSKKNTENVAVNDTNEASVQEVTPVLNLNSCDDQQATVTGIPDKVISYGNSVTGSIHRCSSGICNKDSCNTPNLNATVQLRSNGSSFKTKIRKTPVFKESRVARLNRESAAIINKRIILDIIGEEREMGPTCTSTLCKKWSKRNCSAITHEQRQEIFRHFWNDVSWDAKKRYVSFTTKIEETRHKTTKDQENESRRNKTIFYYLRVGNKKIQVCKSMYLDTLGLKASELDNWLTRNKIKHNDRTFENKIKHNDSGRNLRSRRR